MNLDMDEWDSDYETLLDKEEELEELMGEYLAAETQRRRWSKLLRHAEKEVEHGHRRLQKWTG